jgi:AAA+ ATPase superfamily predicted ATPase
MSHRLREILSRRAIEAFVGRQPELAVLLGVLERDGPFVVHVHGLAGIGKSSLLEIFAAREPGYHGGSNVVDVTVRALRRKLGDQASVLQTVHRIGYRFRI